MKFGIVVLPGSNCDHDALHVTRDILGAEAEVLWHKDTDLKGVDCVILPGGFAYGDYLRAGALAKFAPIMEPIRRHAASGGLVFGICNGFQVLTEAGLLPGALQKNRGLKFLCKTVSLQVVTTRSVLTSASSVGDVLRVPINHFEGNYACSTDRLPLLRSRRARDLGSESQRIGAQHRRHLQPRTQRPRHDAAPRALLRNAPRQRRRAGGLQVDRRLPRARLA